MGKLNSQCATHQKMNVLKEYCQAHGIYKEIKKKAVLILPNSGEWRILIGV